MVQKVIMYIMLEQDLFRPEQARLAPSGGQQFLNLKAEAAGKNSHHLLHASCTRLWATLIKIKINFPHIYGISEWSTCKVIYMRKGFLIYEAMRKCLTIDEEAVSHI
jgi:hypothetical protein